MSASNYGASFGAGQTATFGVTGGTESSAYRAGFGNNSSNSSGSGSVNLRGSTGGASGQFVRRQYDYSE